MDPSGIPARANSSTVLPNRDCKGAALKRRYASNTPRYRLEFFQRPVFRIDPEQQYRQALEQKETAKDLQNEYNPAS